MSVDAALLLFQPRPGDAEDIVWALETAASLWKRGEREDAIGWVRRAANAAADADNDARVLELARVAAELKTALDAPVEPPRFAPVPNAAPSPLSHLSFEQVAAVRAWDEAGAAPPFTPLAGDQDSGHVPTVPPAAPEFHPTPMAMPVAKSVPLPWQAAPPRVASAPAPEAGESRESLSGRLSTAPFGSLSLPPPERDGVALDPQLFDALGQLSPRVRERLEAAACMVVLESGELADAPALLLVLHGALEVRVPGYETRLGVALAGEARLLAPLAPAEGQLDVRASEQGARFLAFDEATVELLADDAPHVLSALQDACDAQHAVAGCLRGRLGASLDGAVLESVLARGKTMRLTPNAKVVAQGEPVRALILVGAGSLTVGRGGLDDSLEAGEVLFAPELVGRRAAPATVRSGAEGALVIVATRSATEELLSTVPGLAALLVDG